MMENEYICKDYDGNIFISMENIDEYELKNKKPPAAADGKEKRVFNSNSISSSNKNYTQKIEGSKFI